MALTLIENGCDDFGWLTATSVFDGNVSTLLAASGYSLTSFAASVAGPYGGTDRALMVWHNSNVSKSLGSNIAEGHFNFYIKITDANNTDGPFFQLLEGGTEQLGLRYSSSNLLLTRNGTQIGATTSGAFIRGTFHYIQFRWVIHDSTGVAIVRLNNSEVINFSGDTQATANAYTNTLQLNRHGFGAGDSHHDYAHLVGYSDSASWPLEECRWEFGDADAAGNYAQFTPLSSTNGSNVDEQQPDGDTSYNSSTTPGNKDSFGTNLAVGSGKTVLASFEEVWAYKTDAGARDLRTFVRTGGADYESASFPLTGAYARYRNFRTTNPDTTAAWTSTEINGAEVGYKDQA